MKKINKDSFISFLSIVLLIIVLTFASTYVKVSSNGNSPTNQAWSVEIDSIDLINVKARARNLDVNASTTTATVNFLFNSVQDEVAYRIRIINTGTIDAVLEDIFLTDVSKEIDYDISGTVIGNKLNAGSSQIFNVVFRNNGDVVASQQAIIINFSYRQIKK